MPYRQIGTWEHPTTHQVFPLFDLQEWNSPYWKKRQVLCELVKKYNLDLVLTIMDVRLMDKTEKYFNPWYGSKQAHEQASASHVYGDPMRPFHLHLAERLIQKIMTADVNLTVEPANEFSPLNWDVQGRPEVPKKWYGWYVQQIQNIGLDDKHLIHSGWKEAVFNQPGIFSHHGIVRPENVPAYSNPRKILLSGDGGFNGEGRADAKGRKGASVEQGKALARIIKQYGFYGYEVMDRGLWKRDNANAYLPDFDATVVKEIMRILNGDESELAAK
jgi:hypothetical protein